MASRAGPWPHPSLSGGGGALGMVAAAISTVALAMTVLGATADPPISLVERGLPAWMIALGLLAGVAVTGTAWAVSVEQPEVAIALAVTSAGLLVPTWAGIDVLPAGAQAVALATAPLAVAGVTHLGLRWSRKFGPSRPVRVVYALAVAAAVIQAAAYNPLIDPGCTVTCTDVEVPLAALVSSRSAYALATALVGTAGALATIQLVREGFRGRSGGVAWASLLAVIVLTTSWVIHAATWTDSRTIDGAMLPPLVAGLLAGLTPVGATVVIRRRRLAVRALVDHLSNGALGEGSEGGRGLRVQFAVPDDGRWVGPSGSEVGPAADPARSVEVSDAGGPVLRLELPAGEDQGELLATLTPATLLALHNARLAAVSRARLADVRASQRRIVEASDAERERIERDLHDGAQQRLVGASFQLSLARARMAGRGDVLASAEASVREALEHLRHLGHGIFPATLTTEGLAAALEDEARASGVPTSLDLGELRPDLERDVALAAYLVVATALAHAGRVPGPVSADVTAATREDRLTLHLRLIGSVALAQDDLVDVADRVGAVGGQLAVRPIDGGVAISAEMPCA